jgi:hypothetical protein
MRFEINIKFQPEEAKLKIWEEQKREKKKKERRSELCLSQKAAYSQDEQNVRPPNPMTGCFFSLLI